MPRKRLSDDDVRSIRNLRAAGKSQYVLAKEFGVSQPLICAIVNGHRRRDAGGPIQVKLFADDPGGVLFYQRYEFREED